MTGYQSKKASAQDKLNDDDTQVYKDHGDALTIAYQSGYYDGKKAALAGKEPLPKSEWPNHPSAYEFGSYMGYDKSDLDNYAMRVLGAHGIKEKNTCGG